MEVKVINNKVIASVLAIGTAVPPNEFLQCNYPNFFFNITNCNDKLELKEKFQHICDKSTIKKRHFYLTEEILKANPEMCNYMGTSLNQRQEIAIREVPRLAKDAASNAIKEWGKPMSCITHLVFCTTSGVDMPGADFQLIKLLGLPLDVKRVMLYQQGCFAGATVIRIAKDLAENNPTARVLAICSEVSALTFRAPSESHLDGLVGSALFGDGAAALIIGSNPSPIEKPLFEVHWAGQSITPDSDNAILGHLHEAGLIFHLLKDVPRLISTNIEKILVKPLQYITAFDNHKQTLSYNDLFWVVHPGGPAILDQVETQLLLNKDRMQATRDVLADYGNMSSASVLFVLDRMRKRSIELNEETTGDGLKWGVMLTFGPGLTIESLVLKSA